MLAQEIDVCGEQTLAPVGQIDREKETAARNKIATVVGHRSLWTER